MLRVALIGFGGIAQLHRYGYWYQTCAGQPVELVAACDANPEAFRRMTVINLEIPNDLPLAPSFAEYTDWKQMLDEQKPDLVDICLPTCFHESVAVEVLKRGYSVLCEKPMAESYESCKHMLEVAADAPGKLMIAQCVRFYPQYDYLYKAVKDGRYGKAVGARFSRVTPLPNWGGKNWRKIDKRTGSSLTELNVHDIDVMQYIFGCPSQVSCRLESRRTPYDISTSVFYYDDLEVEVYSEWQDEDGKFCMSYTVEFEQGTLCFDGESVYFIDNSKVRENIELSDQSGIVEEIGYFTRLLIEGEDNDRNPPEQSAYTIYMLEKCFESNEQGGIKLNLEVLYES